MKNIIEIFKRKLDKQQFEGKEKNWAILEARLNKEMPSKGAAYWNNKINYSLLILFGFSLMAWYKLSVSRNELKMQGKNAEQHVETKKITNKLSATNNASAALSNNINNNINQYKLTTRAHQKQEIVPVTTSQLLADEQKQEIKNYTASVAKNTIFPLKNKTKHYSPSSIKNTAAKTNNKEKKLNEKLTESTLSTDDNSGYISNKMDAIVDTEKEHKTNSTTNNFEPEVITAISAKEPNSNLLAEEDLAHKKLMQTIKFNALLPSNFQPIAADKKVVEALNVTDAAISKKSKNSWSLSVYGGAMQSTKNLITTAANSDSYLTRRNKEELKIITPTAGIDVNLKRGHWSLTSGVNFHQQGEQKNYSNDFIRNVTNDSIVTTISQTNYLTIDTTSFFITRYNNTLVFTDTLVTYYSEISASIQSAIVPIGTNNTSQGVVQYFYIIDSTSNTINDTVKTIYKVSKIAKVTDLQQANLKGKNKINYVEIPLLVGYEWGVKRWRLNIQTGVGFGLLTNQKTYYLSTDESEIKPIANEVYKKLVYNYILRVGLHYSFTPAIGIDIVPIARFNLNNTTNKNNSFQQKYHQLGLQLGLTYRL